MNTMLLIKLFFVLLSAILVFTSLIRLNRHKAHFRIYPESVKKDMYKKAGGMTLVNIFSALLLIGSYFLLHNMLFFIPVLLSLLLSLNSIYAQEEEFGLLHGDAKDKIETKNKKKDS